MKLLKIIVVLAALAAPALRAQQQQTIPPGTVPTSAPAVPPGFGRSQGEGGPFSPGAQERLEKGRQTDRQKKLVADTDRLLNLATQLKAEMDKTTKDTLSIDVIKKAEEIEKLAKSVKERMKG